MGGKCERQCRVRVLKTKKAKNVAGNKNKVILCDKCFGNYMK